MLLYELPGTVSRGDHERKDADVVSLFLVAGLLLICGALVVFSCLGLLHFFHVKDAARSKRVATATADGREFPEPRLIVTPAADLEELRAREDEELKSYAWIDRKSGNCSDPDRARDGIDCASAVFRQSARTRRRYN